MPLKFDEYPNDTSFDTLNSENLYLTQTEDGLKNQ